MIHNQEYAEMKKLYDNKQTILEEEKGLKLYLKALILYRNPIRIFFFDPYVARPFRLSMY